MGRPGPHDKLLLAAAREQLRPLGLTQRGRSRVWLDDHGWWVGVVEFQPSSWSKGSYVNVGASWMWKPGRAVLSFDSGGRKEGFSEFEREDQFAPLARRLAERAAVEVIALRKEFPSIELAARGLVELAGAIGCGWPEWHAAVALGLAGEKAASRAMFQRVTSSEDDRAWWLPVKRQAAELALLVDSDERAYQAAIDAMIDRARAALRLPARTAP